MYLAHIATWIGLSVVAHCRRIGSFIVFLYRALRTSFLKRVTLKKICEQIAHIGIESVNIVIVTGSFTGIVFALQSYIGFQRVGGERFIGAVVALGMIRELGPVLTGLMVAGRAGSAIAAEIGTMRITEQIDALRSLCIDPLHYLVVPRIVASVVVLPLLALFSMVCGIVGGYGMSVYVLLLSPQEYIDGIKSYVVMSDVVSGLVKSSVFGLLLSWVGCYKGYYTTGGARGVGRATTQTVVLASIMILIANAVLTSCMKRM